MPETAPTETAADYDSRRNRRAVGDAPVACSPAGLRPGRVRLEGKRVVLSPVDPDRHGPALFAIGHGSLAALELWRYLPNGPFVDRPAMQTWLRGCAGAADPMFFVIAGRDDGRLMGMASFLNIRPDVGVIEIGHIWLAPPFQRTLPATEALFVMMSHVLDDLGSRRLEWKCNALNGASRRAALRLGFRFEGVFFNHMIVKGRSRDTAWYSLLDSEWPPVRHNIRAWLRADNFDAAGRQRTSLGAANRALW